MRFADIVLVGYYGFGNFGDDILLRVTHSIVKDLRPAAQIAVRTIRQADYILRLLDDEVTRLPFGTRSRHDWLVHGGGGTFFDFNRYGVLARMRNALALAFGTQVYVGAERALRAVLNRPRLEGAKRIGLGIGIGQYAPGSRKLLDALPQLCRFDTLWVRDRRSLHHLKTLGVQVPTIVGSDLAFLHKFWCPPELFLRARAKRNVKPRIALVLRDWQFTGGQRLTDLLEPAVGRLQRDYDLTLVSLHPETDTECLRRWPHLTTLVWEPERCSVAQFAQALALHDVYVSARAHGAICMACLGRAGVLLDIEPKLETVREMLPRSASLLRHPFDADELTRAVEKALEIPARAIEFDVHANEALSSSALQCVIEQVAE